MKTQPLNEQEKAEMDRLWEEERKAMDEYYKARAEAKAAVIRRNLAQKKFTALQRKWLVLAERHDGSGVAPTKMAVAA